MVQIDGYGNLIPSTDSFNYSNLIRHSTFSDVASFNSWVYYAIQITPTTVKCYINGSLSSEATLASIYGNLGDIANTNTDNNFFIDEVIIAEDNVYRKNNAEWIIE